MTRPVPLAFLILTLSLTAALGQDLSLETGWNNPPLEARTRCFWWWLNGNVTKDAITRDLEEMRDKGMGGGLIFDADGSGQRKKPARPRGPPLTAPNRGGNCSSTPSPKPTASTSNWPSPSKADGTSADPTSPPAKWPSRSPGPNSRSSPPVHSQTRSRSRPHSLRLLSRHRRPRHPRQDPQTVHQLDSRPQI